MSGIRRDPAGGLVGMNYSSPRNLTWRNPSRQTRRIPRRARSQPSRHRLTGRPHANARTTGHADPDHRSRAHLQRRHRHRLAVAPSASATPSPSRRSLHRHRPAGLRRLPRLHRPAFPRRQPATIRPASRRPRRRRAAPTVPRPPTPLGHANHIQVSPGQAYGDRLGVGDERAARRRDPVPDLRVGQLWEAGEITTTLTPSSKTPESSPPEFTIAGCTCQLTGTSYG